MSQPITPCLWFAHEAEEAAKFYCSVFKDSKINYINYYGKEGHDVHHQKEGSVLVVGFTINGQSFTALNAGPLFKFNESVSFQIGCNTQEEIDYYWDKLTSDGGQESQCGWCKDKYGLSWQVNGNAEVMTKIMSDPAKSEKAMKALMQMKKLDLNKLQNP